MSGDIDEAGQDLRTALRAHVKYGAVPKTLTDLSLDNHDQSFLRRISSWPAGLFVSARAQKKKAFVKITGPYDHFDNIRATIYKFSLEKRAVVMGLIWNWSLQEEILDGGSDVGSGHAICSIGWQEMGLVLQNSYGLSAGVDGCHIITRKTVNLNVEKYGAYMFVDLSPDEVAWMLEHGIKLEDNWFKAIFKALTSWAHSWK